MSYTYNWQKQPIVSWKAKTNNSVIPSWSRPINNSDNDQTPNVAFKARPIKHWRKQLMPRENSGSGNSAVGMPMDLPGGSSYLGDNISVCNNNSSLMTIKEENNSNKDCCTKTKVIRRSTTNLDKKYYTDSKAYLKSRCRTYDQNISGTPVENANNYDANGNLLEPNDNNNGPQVRIGLNCSMGCDSNNKVKTIYKPNNKKFQTQGAVTSGERLLRLKMNTINDNGASFQTAYGSQAANAGKYHGTSESPYFVKSKENKCSTNTYYRRGKRSGGKLASGYPCP